MDLWKRYTLDIDRTYHWRLGRLELWVAHSPREWRVAFRTKREEHRVAVTESEKHAAVAPLVATDLAKPDDLPWSRIAVPGDSGEIDVIPVMPDRSLVVRPESPFVLPHKVKASLYVSIPVWVRLVIHDGEPITIAEVPTVVLSNTWFGSPAAGELCYSLSTRARRNPADGVHPIHRAVCPVSVANSSARDLQFARLCLQVGALAVYEGAHFLLTSEVDVTYQEDEQEARAHFGSGPPNVEGVGRLLGGARVKRRESVLARGLTTIRSLTGL